jgi:hypothetical protein
VPRTWSDYSRTVLRFPGTDLVVDLAKPLSPDVLRAFATLGLGGSFGVLTACDPLGRIHDQGSNQRLAAVLAALVRERHPAARPATGSSPDGTHADAGWAIPAPLEVIRNLAAAFLQDSVFWFDGRRFSIEPVHSAADSLTLPARSPDAGPVPR